MIGWWRLSCEFDRWAAVGQRPRLWWRDDDAAAVTLNLARLVALSERFRVPLLLAVVPGGEAASTLDQLGRFLTGRSSVFVGQHGVAHANRRRPGEPDAEFPPWQAPEVIATAIAAAWPRIAALPGSLPVFVPPWNAVHPALEVALCRLGLALSAAGESVLDAAPAQLDVLRWRRGPTFRGRDSCLRRLRRMLRQRRLAGAWAQPVGLLTHHLAHDIQAWRFVEELLARTHADRRVLWVPPPELVGPRPAPLSSGQT